MIYAILISGQRFAENCPIRTGSGEALANQRADMPNDYLMLRHCSVSQLLHSGTKLS